MAQIIVTRITRKGIWEEFLKTRNDVNFLQSWYWGQFHRDLGKQITRSGFYRNRKLVGVCLSVIEPARRSRYLTVPGGPIIDWHDPEVVAAFRQDIINTASAEKCVFIRVRPQITDTPESRDIFKSLGFRDAPVHLHAELTSQLDITRTEEELLSGMRKSTRYEIRKALNTGIKVTGTTDERFIRFFYDLQCQTARRQHFIPFSYEFLHRQFQVFAGNKLAILYSAHINTTLLAQAFIIFYGQEAVYHYGAGSPEGRTFPGAYLIQWTAIKEARKMGISRYNFWGVAPESDMYHRFAGLSVFKRGFGGTDVTYLHAQDLVLNLPLYGVNAAIEFSRKVTRRI